MSESFERRAIFDLFREPELCAKPTDQSDDSEEKSDKPEEMLINDTAFGLKENDRRVRGEKTGISYVKHRRLSR